MSIFCAARLFLFQLHILHFLQVRDKYYKDVRTAGPKSKILEGLGLEDDDLIGMDGLPVADSRDGAVSPAQVVSPRGTLLRLDPANPPTLEPGHVVVVGAVSKGVWSFNAY